MKPVTTISRKESTPIIGTWAWKEYSYLFIK